MFDLTDARLQKENLNDVARTLGRPWLTYRMGRFGDLALDLFVCHGSIAMHRHWDEDELFLVVEGTILLGSERGDVTLRMEEAAIARKGLAHQSSAFTPAVVVLLRPAVDSRRQNGRWRMFATTRDPALEKVNLGALYTGLSAAYQPVKAMMFLDWGLWLMRCAGVGPACRATPGGVPLLVLRGMVAVIGEREQVMPARKGDVVAVPPGMGYHLETDVAAMVAWLEPEAGGSST